MHFFKRVLSFKLFFLCVLLTFTLQAHALPITPGAADYTGPIDGAANQNSDSLISGYIESLIGPATLLYKAEVGPEENEGLPVTEEGFLADNYETVFSNTQADPSDATITHQGGDIVGSPAWLLVKDGNNEPWWYLFNLTDLYWDGIEDLVLSGFWAGQGAISHVSLYGAAQPVPEPATLLLLGVGLAGLVGMRKKFIKN